MDITVGGKTYALAPLRVLDVRDLGKLGITKLMTKFSELEDWQQSDVIFEIAAASVRRGGVQVTARELQDQAENSDLVAVSAALPWILEVSKLIRTGGQDPNAQGPSPAK